MTNVAAAIEVEELLEELAARTPAGTSFMWHREDCPSVVLGIMADLSMEQGRARLPVALIATTGKLAAAGEAMPGSYKLAIGRWVIVAWDDFNRRIERDWRIFND